MRAPAAGALSDGARDLDQRLDLRRQATSPRRARNRRVYREERSSRAPTRNDPGARGRNDRRTARPDKRLSRSGSHAIAVRRADEFRVQPAAQALRESFVRATSRYVNERGDIQGACRVSAYLRHKVPQRPVIRLARARNSTQARLPVMGGVRGRRDNGRPWTRNPSLSCGRSALPSYARSTKLLPAAPRATSI